MSAARHTPGPWFAWKSPDGQWTVKAVYDDAMGLRTTAWPAVCNAGAQDNEANARLMAASPELVDALKAALEWIDAVPPETVLPTMPGFDRDDVNDLLAKAEGRS